MKDYFKKFLLLLSLLFAVSSCSAGKNTIRNGMETPKSWHNIQPKEVSETFIFNDQKLQTLLKRALGQNFSLKSAALQVERARALARIEGADQFPVESLMLDGERGESHIVGENESVRVADKKIGSRMLLSWELDIWGRLKDQAMAGQLDYTSSLADYQSARLSLGSRIARSWFSTIAAKEKVLEASDVVASYTSTLEAVEERYHSGLIDALDLLMAQTALADAKADLQHYSQNLTTEIQLLETLVGDYPSGDLVIGGQLPTQFQAVPAGIPADMVADRPDLIATREKLAAADYRTSAAAKALLPTITLSASIGSGRKRLKEVFNPEYGFWNLIGGITQPLTQGDRLWAQADEVRLEAQQIWFEYLNQLLNAFSEVERSLSAEVFLIKRQKRIEETFSCAEEAWELAKGKYSNGNIDLLTALVNQRQFLNSRMQVVEIRNERVQNQIDLVLALGGSFVAKEQQLTIQ